MIKCAIWNLSKYWKYLVSELIGQLYAEVLVHVDHFRPTGHGEYAACEDHTIVWFLGLTQKTTGTKMPTTVRVLYVEFELLTSSVTITNSLNDKTGNGPVPVERDECGVCGRVIWNLVVTVGVFVGRARSKCGHWA